MVNDDSSFRLPNRDETINLLKNLPESIYLDEIIQYLYIHQQILIGHKDAIEGKSITTEEARFQLRKWFD